MSGRTDYHLLRIQEEIRINSNQIGRIGDLIEHQIALQEEERLRLNSLPHCPYCGGVIQGKYSVCQYCKNKINWLFNAIPYMDNCRDDAYNTLQGIILKSFNSAVELVEKEERRNRQIILLQEKKRLETYRIRVGIATFIILVIIIVLLLR